MRGVIISLCDLSGVMAEPWLAAGYEAVLVDPQHQRYSSDGQTERLPWTVLEASGRLGTIIRGRRVVLVAGFPPCTDVAVSGARWFAAKAAIDRHFQTRAALVAEQCRMVGQLSGAPWFFENPVSVFSSIFGPASHSFQPYDYAGLCAEDNYVKRTLLWAGNGFVMPDKCPAPELGTPDALRIRDLAPTPERQNLRSMTPRGFAEAVYLANAPHLRQQMELWDAEVANG
jgi:hypothetical protein